MRDAPMLAAHHVVHRYGGVLALNDVSLEVSRGEFVSVLGANGAGKTTLGLVMAGAMAPTGGEVACDGSPAGRRDKLLPGVSIVPEGRRLFGQLTVRENLLLGGYGAGACDAEIRERMHEVLGDLPKALRDDPGRREIGRAHV